VWEFESTVSEVIARTPFVKSFRFATGNASRRYQAGQFFFLTVRIDGEEAVHHFSFSSSPTEKNYIELTKRITSSRFSQALDSLKPGDWARLQGPEGTFTLPRKIRQLAFLSGGIGITPLRSMLCYIADMKLVYDVVLVYGNETERDIVFRDELDTLAANHHGIRIEYVLSGETPSVWPGGRGFINSALVSKVVPDYRERLFYVSGPPRMVLTLMNQLVALGISEDQIKRDSFTGYD